MIRLSPRIALSRVCLLLGGAAVVHACGIPLRSPVAEQQQQRRKQQWKQQWKQQQQREQRQQRTHLRRRLVERERQQQREQQRWLVCEPPVPGPRMFAWGHHDREWEDL